ncbi:yeats family-domain-containing protein [Blyttiomyces helicus]|uniref:Protein AF-9 homolog n=1 Tax=Blyttiomyces helicus TaxID=388810 RepID=A0A4P9VZ10_9FUNG|nr:yeats family-domain-containing protein [Blyttiomyces helicus]|eukprot:RKO84994.1 yeats family-domain-containing protein [Blyttiomyces helicus]
MQGFLNHCRLAHLVEFPSHSEAARVCGTPVSEDEVPLKHPARRMLIRPAAFEKPTNFDWTAVERTFDADLVESGKLASKPEKIKPKIKVYEEDLDLMDMDAAPLIPPTESFEPLAPLDPEESPAGESVGPQRPTTDPTPPSDDPVPMDIDEAPSTDDPDVPMTEADLAARKVEEAADHQPAPTRADAAQPVKPPPVQSVSVSKSAEGSRFYVKKRIIIGNVSRYIPVGKRDAGMEKYQYKWMVYLHGPPLKKDVTSFVKKIRFYLHPDYRPYDVVDVNDPPFHLTRYGWGEFPVRLQVHFVDPRNKPIDIIYILKLDTARTGRQIMGGETPYDLELDRYTEFVAPRPLKTVDEVERTEDMSLDETAGEKADLPDDPPSDFIASIDAELLLENEQTRDAHAALGEAVGRFPLFGQGKAVGVGFGYGTRACLKIRGR